jgi:hypothetical protein
MPETGLEWVGAYFLVVIVMLIIAKVAEVWMNR